MMRWWHIRKRNADLDRELQSDLQLEQVVPLLPLLGRNRRPKHRNSQSRCRQDVFQSCVDVLLACIGRINLTAAALSQFVSYILDQRGLSGIENIPAQFLGPCDQQFVILFRCRIERPRLDLIEAVRMIRIEEKRIEQDAHQAFVAAIFRHGAAQRLFEFFVGFPKLSAHVA